MVISHSKNNRNKCDHGDDFGEWVRMGEDPPLHHDDCLCDDDMLSSSPSSSCTNQHDDDGDGNNNYCGSGLALIFNTYSEYYVVTECYHAYSHPFTCGAESAREMMTSQIVSHSEPPKAAKA